MTHISCNLYFFLGFQTSSDLKRHKKTRVHQERVEQGGSAAGESGGIDFSTDIDLDQVGNRNRNLYCTLGQSGVGEQHVKRRGHSHLTVPVLPVVHLGGSQPRLLKLFEHVLHIAKLPPAVGGGNWRRVQPLGLRADHDLAQRSPGKQLHPAAECSAVQPPKHHLGPVRHQVGDLGASPPGEGDQQSRRAGGGDGVIVEEETHPPARSCHLPCSGLGWTDQSQGGWLPHGISNFYLPVTIPPVHHAVDYKEFTGTGFKLRYFR